MKVIFARSPFIISVSDPSQFATKFELYLYRKGETIPVAPTKVFEKVNPSTTQTENYINISPFVKDYLQNISPELTSEFEQEDYGMHCSVRVKTYSDLVGDGTYTLVDTLDYVAVNGFTLYQQGANNYIEADLVYLINPSLTVYTNDNHITLGANNLKYFNILVDWKENGTSETVTAKYYKKTTLEQSVDLLTGADDNGVYMFKVAFRTDDVDLDNGNTVEVYLTTMTEEEKPAKINFTNVCEPKYTPVVCSYINRFGGWSNLTFFKARTDDINSDSKAYNLNQPNWDYNVKIGSRQFKNFNSKQKIRLNTGWVDENYSENIFDLMNSETVLLDGVPASVETKSQPIKTSLKELINYEIEFEFAFNLINTIT